MPTCEKRVQMLQNWLIRARGRGRTAYTMRHSAPMSLADVFQKWTAGTWCFPHKGFSREGDTSPPHLYIKHKIGGMKLRSWGMCQRQSLGFNSLIEGSPIKQGY